MTCIYLYRILLFHLTIPILSPNPSPAEGKAVQPPERKRKDANEAYRVYEEIIKDNILSETEKSGTSSAFWQKLKLVVDILTNH